MSRTLALALALFSPAALADANLFFDHIEGDEDALGNVFVDLTVKNDGDTIATGIYVDLFESKGGLWNDPAGVEHHFFYIPILRPGEVKDISFQLQADGWKKGPVYATVDLDDWTPEDDEKDNLAQLYILPFSPTEPVLACANLNVAFPAVLLAAMAPFNPNFAALQQPHLYCKSRVL